MIAGTVTGQLWATRQLEGLPSGAFLEVQSDDGNHVVAFDPLGSGVGERVLVAQGSVAAAWFPGTTLPIDALIIGSIDPHPDIST